MVAHPIRHRSRTQRTNAIDPSTYVGKLRTGTLRYHRIDHQSEKITVIGTALVLLQATGDLTVNGVRKAMKCSALAVWVNESGSWKFIAHQPTPQH